LYVGVCIKKLVAKKEKYVCWISKIATIAGDTRVHILDSCGRHMQLVGVLIYVCIVIMGNC
jgi:hypothetical protein